MPGCDFSHRPCLVKLGDIDRHDINRRHESRRRPDAARGLRKCRDEIRVDDSSRLSSLRRGLRPALNTYTHRRHGPRDGDRPGVSRDGFTRGGRAAVRGAWSTSGDGEALQRRRRQRRFLRRRFVSLVPRSVVSPYSPGALHRASARTFLRELGFGGHELGARFLRGGRGGRDAFPLPLRGCFGFYSFLLLGLASSFTRGAHRVARFLPSTRSLILRAPRGIRGGGPVLRGALRLRREPRAVGSDPAKLGFSRGGSLDAAPRRSRRDTRDDRRAPRRHGSSPGERGARSTRVRLISHARSRVRQTPGAAVSRHSETVASRGKSVRTVDSSRLDPVDYLLTRLHGLDVPNGWSAG